MAQGIVIIKLSEAGDLAKVSGTLDQTFFSFYFFFLLYNLIV